MAEKQRVSMNSTAPSLPKKRKLKHPRTSVACSFCRKRKARCSGTQPCDLCLREEVTCEYASERPPRAPQASKHGSPAGWLTPEQSTLNPGEGVADGRGSTSRPRDTTDNDSSVHRGNSADVPGLHIGPTSGVSFLYHHWAQEQGHDSQNELSGSEREDHAAVYQPRLATYGDIAPLDHQTVTNLPQPVFKTDHIVEVLERYFEYVSPSQRFLHHPTVKEWASAYVRQDSSLTASQAAVVLLVCAQTLLQPFKFRDEEVISSITCHKLGLACWIKAKALLEQERGPASLVSVQARIALCLYLLSTFRLNECRYCFSFTVTIATAMGLHRRHSTARVSCLEAECRKRTFWSLYILDGYLSVMLGRPRLLRIDDIDQPLPVNVDDYDLTACEVLDHVPKHGNLEALIAQATLAKLTARNDDELYPLYALDDHELLQRSGGMLDQLQRWHEELPSFLQPREKTATGQRTFERQYTILKLAAAHTRILMTRRCLLIDFKDDAVGTTALRSHNTLAQRCVRECVAGISATLDTIEALIISGNCHSSFWSTQYIALVALSTLYVLILQGFRHTLPDVIDSYLDVNVTLAKSKRCQDFLAALAPPGSQAKRHHLLLARLRSKVEKSVFRQERPMEHLRQPNLESESANRGAQSARLDQIVDMGDHGEKGCLNPVPLSAGATILPVDRTTCSASRQISSHDLTAFSTMLTPNSSSDAGFDHMLDYGWEGLDTVGIFTSGYDLEGFSMPANLYG